MYLSEIWMECVTSARGVKLQYIQNLIADVVPTQLVSKDRPRNHCKHTYVYLSQIIILLLLLWPKVAKMRPLIWETINMLLVEDSFYCVFLRSISAQVQYVTTYRLASRFG